MSANVVTIKNLDAYYGKQKVVKNVQLDVATNEVTALIGPSGCGKSTILRCINRLHEEAEGAWFEGEITLEGKNILHQDAASLRSHIGMVFQKPNPFPSYSIFENAAAGLFLRGHTKRKVLEEIVEKNLKQVGLWDEVKDKLKASGSSLSGGQQQRLCIARALSVSPPVILMDEPTSALDPISTAKIEELLVHLKKTVSVVIVTHNLAQAARISDNVAYMYLGELMEFGKTKEVFARPKNKKTAEYLSGLEG